MNISKKLIFLLLFPFLALSLQSCSNDSSIDADRLITVTVDSKALGKNMQSKVYLPKGYNSDTKYPVLYFIHDYGGTSDTVLYDYGIAEKADKLINDNKIKPMIIVTLRIESSFGINSGSENKRVRLESGKSFFEGMYEDYIIKEAIPLIDSQFSTSASKESRYIGGYSLGGFAALHKSFCSKIL